MVKSSPQQLLLARSFLIMTSRSLRSQECHSTKILCHMATLQYSLLLNSLRKTSSTKIKLINWSKFLVNKSQKLKLRKEIQKQIKFLKISVRLILTLVLQEVNKKKKIKGKVKVWEEADSKSNANSNDYLIMYVIFTKIRI